MYMCLAFGTSRIYSHANLCYNCYKVVDGWHITHKNVYVYILVCHLHSCC